jgi:putative oxidoreductase
MARDRDRIERSKGVMTMIRRLWTWLLDPPVTGPRATMVIRLMAGGVFFWEGILKFVYENQGVGRFTKLGIPFPLVTAPFVGWLEIVGGILLMLGLGTRLIAIPFIAEMLVAMLSTKPRLFLGTLPLPPPPVPPQVGMWAVLHEIRSEYAQIMSCIFLLISGPGPWSLDATLRSSAEKKDEISLSDRSRSPRSGMRSHREDQDTAPDPRRAVGR